MEILDSMLAGTATIEETVIMINNTIYCNIAEDPKYVAKSKARQTQVEWAQNYVPRKSSAFDPSKVRR